MAAKTAGKQTPSLLVSLFPCGFPNQSLHKVQRIYIFSLVHHLNVDVASLNGIVLGRLCHIAQKLSLLQVFSLVHGQLF